jgi:hypothetical protein
MGFHAALTFKLRLSFVQQKSHTAIAEGLLSVSGAGGSFLPSAIVPPYHSEGTTLERYAHGNHPSA